MNKTFFDSHHLLDEFYDQGIRLSQAFLREPDCLIIIDHPSIFDTKFSYKRYCQKQNEWMRQYGKVFRFLEGDPELDRFLKDEVREEPFQYQLGFTLDREHMLADPSPLEYRFEEYFILSFTVESLY